MACQSDDIIDRKPCLVMVDPNGTSQKSCNKGYYNPKWESDPLLKSWIGPSATDVSKVTCSVCCSDLRAHKNCLMEHARTLKHRRNLKLNGTPEQYKEFLAVLKEHPKNPTSAVCKLTKPKAREPEFEHIGDIEIKPVRSTQKKSTTAANGKTGQPVQEEIKELTCTTRLSTNSNAATTGMDMVINILSNDYVTKIVKHDPPLPIPSPEQRKEGISPFIGQSKENHGKEDTLVEMHSPPSSFTDTNNSIMTLNYPIEGSNDSTSEIINNVSLSEPLVLSGLTPLGNGRWSLAKPESTPSVVFDKEETTGENANFKNGEASVGTQQPLPNTAFINDNEKPVPSSFTAVINAINEGCFSIAELCQLSRAALSKIEEGVGAGTVSDNQFGDGQTEYFIPVSLITYCSD